jgi:hypothetical protein
LPIINPGDLWQFLKLIINPLLRSGALRSCHDNRRIQSLAECFDQGLFPRLGP